MIPGIIKRSRKCCLFLASVCLLLGANISVWAQQAVLPGSSPGDTQGRKILFDNDWRFHKGGAQGANAPGFADSTWRKIDLPHDWSIEDIPGTGSPFSRDAISQVMGGFTTGGLAWYRKTFVVPASQKGKRIRLQFDGIYMNADFWLNGRHLGNHPYGYTSFWYDITNDIKPGEKNVLAIQVKNNGQNSRWYSGSGIYRHVWLSFLDPVHIAHWGVAIATPAVNEKAATVNIKTNIRNESAAAAKVTVVTHILDRFGRERGRVTSEQEIAADTDYLFDQNTNVSAPDLWSVQSPHLYRAVTEVYSDRQLSDRLTTIFGIRTIAYDAVNGLRLNGKEIKLKGGCLHDNNGPLGSRDYDRADQRRIELLKASGFNAVRCAHNPPSPAFLAACDSIGMMVIDEAFDMWEEGKTPYDYHLYFNEWWKKDIQSMILRDRNHPSIIMWSIGNEIPGMDNPNVVKTAHELADYARRIGPGRPITAAVNGVSQKKDAFFSALDICGYNYARDHYVSDHERQPQRVMFATESYPLEAFDYWMEVKDHPWVIGDFVWTAFDYIGEASIGWRGYPQENNFYPWTLAFCGDIDICGWKRPQSYYRDVLWQNRPQAYIFVKPPRPSFPVNPQKADWSIWNWDDVVADWNWKKFAGQPLQVVVYSACPEVELFLNGRSLGKKEANRSTRFTASWEVPYQAGELKAIGYNGSKEIISAVLRTADAPVKIRLSADRKRLKADNQDLSYITVELVDVNGVRNPKAENEVKFRVSGPGSIVGVGNANPMSTESYQLPQRKAWKGRCLVIVKSGNNPGKITLTASSDGLPSSSVTINAD